MGNYKEAYSQLHKETFVRSGYMLALPLCFPGASTSIEWGESKINALTISPDHNIYGVTDGEKSHLFVAMTRGVTGFCFDMGIVPDHGRSTSVVCSNKAVFICNGSNLYSHAFQPVPFDCIQEWEMIRSPFEDLSLNINSDPIIHAIGTADRTKLIGVTMSELFVVDIDNKPGKLFHTEDLQTRAETKILLASDNNIYGVDSKAGLWRFDPDTFNLKKDICAFNRGNSPVTMCTLHSNPAILVGIDDELFKVEPCSGRNVSLGKVMAGPITTMAATFDSRVFGTAGKEIERMFAYNTTSGSINDIGVCVSIFGTRRYGYNFREAVTGSQGEIFFGEHDCGGHLWVYFPSIQKNRMKIN